MLGSGRQRWNPLKISSFVASSGSLVRGATRNCDKESFTLVWRHSVRLGVSSGMNCICQKSICCISNLSLFAFVFLLYFQPESFCICVLFNSTCLLDTAALLLRIGYSSYYLLLSANKKSRANTLSKSYHTPTDENTIHGLTHYPRAYTLSKGYHTIHR